jgi:hypothetical protein
MRSRIATYREISMPARRLISVKSILRKMLLAFLLGGRAALGIGMTREEIEAILYSNTQTRVEVTILRKSEMRDPPIS